MKLQQVSVPSAFAISRTTVWFKSDNSPKRA